MMLLWSFYMLEGPFFDTGAPLVQLIKASLSHKKKLIA